MKDRRKIRTVLRHMSIRHKLLLITSFGVALIIIASISGLRSAMKTSNEILYEQTANSLSVISDKISARLNNVMEISLTLAINKDFQSLLATVNTDSAQSTQAVARSNIYSQLTRTHQRDINSITIYPKDSSPVMFGYMNFPKTGNISRKAREQAEKAKGAPVWFSESHDDGSILCIREIRNVNRPFLDQMGYIAINVNLSKIVQESIADVITSDFNIVIDQNEKLLYAGSSQNENDLENVPAINSIYEVIEWNNVMNFVIQIPIKTQRSNWSMVFGIPYDSVFHSLTDVYSLVMVSVLIIAIISLILSHQMSVSINHNVEILTQKMDRVRKGNLEPYMNEASLGMDELGMLNLHFDQMTAEFKRVTQDNYEKELLLTQTQLKALEQQLNPHFLYNSLDTIKWFAKRGEDQQVSIIVQALGLLLRKTLSVNEDRISLGEEIEIMDSYLDIQRIRFQDRLSISKKIDARAHAVLVPKMSILPLVENAIIHALEENIGECHIAIEATQANSQLSVSVINDGSSIDENILTNLHNKKTQARRQGIGLTNIDSRIKLLYGQEYGLDFQNNNGHVIVSYSIPVKYSSNKKENRDEIILH